MKLHCRKREKFVILLVERLQVLRKRTGERNVDETRDAGEQRAKLQSPTETSKCSTRRLEVASYTSVTVHTSLAVRVNPHLLPLTSVGLPSSDRLKRFHLSDSLDTGFTTMAWKKKKRKQNEKKRKREDKQLWHTNKRRH